MVKPLLLVIFFICVLSSFILFPFFYYFSPFLLSFIPRRKVLHFRFLFITFLPCTGLFSICFFRISFTFLLLFAGLYFVNFLKDNDNDYDIYAININFFHWCCCFNAIMSCFYWSFSLLCGYNFLLSWSVWLTGNFIVAIKRESLFILFLFLVCNFVLWWNRCMCVCVWYYNLQYLLQMLFTFIKVIEWILKRILLKKEQNCKAIQMKNRFITLTLLKQN